VTRNDVKQHHVAGFVVSAAAGVDVVIVLGVQLYTSTLTTAGVWSRPNRLVTSACISMHTCSQGDLR
jgi:hypothetical protein